MQKTQVKHRPLFRAPIWEVRSEYARPRRKVVEWRCRATGSMRSSRGIPFIGPKLSVAAKTALHEAGHAVAWHMGGGKIRRVSIWRQSGGWCGLCTYATGPTLSPTQRHLLARAAFAGPLTVAVAGDPDVFAWPHDYEAAVQILAPLYADRARLHKAAQDCWINALELMSSPSGFGSAVALAGQLVRQRVLSAFPTECHRIDYRSDPRLSEAAARLRADFPRVVAEDLAYAVAWVCGEEN
jgi:hypothetical protein